MSDRKFVDGTEGDNVDFLPHLISDDISSSRNEANDSPCTECDKQDSCFGYLIFGQHLDDMREERIKSTIRAYQMWVGEMVDKGNVVVLGSPTGDIGVFGNIVISGRKPRVEEVEE